MRSREELTVREADWQRDQLALRALRTKVFIEEQGVPVEEEWDGRDPECLHLLVEDPQGRALGCGRLFPDGRIGRMAVLREMRGRGLGKQIVQRFIELAAARGQATLVLDAQLHAIPFYARFGFVAEGPEFEDAGILHRRMVRRE